MARFNVTIQSSQVTADLTDFPVYIDLSDMPASFWSTVSNGGGDIRAYKSDGTTELPREVVFCDTTTDTGELHVKYTGTLSGSTNTVIEIDVDGIRSDYARGATYGSDNVWKSNYLSVHHFEGGVADSTSNSRTTTNNGSTSIAGQLGNARSFDGTDDSLTMPLDASSMPALSISGWMEYSTTAGTQVLFELGPNFNNTTPAFIAHITTDKLNVGINGNIGYNISQCDAPSINTMRHFTFTYDASAASASENNIYINGSQPSSIKTHASENTNVGYLNSTLNVFSRNNSSFFGSGKLDELRIYNGVQSTDWVATEYNNQSSSSTFYTTSASNTEMNTYYFDASDSGPTDPDTNWSNDANAFDGDTVTVVTATNVGSVSSNYLGAGGTNAPASGGTITQVRARVHGSVGFAPPPTVNAAIATSGWGEVLGTATNSNQLPAWGSYTTLSTPSGGWTWAKLQELETRIFFTNQASEHQASRVEIEVTSENTEQTLSTDVFGASFSTPVANYTKTHTTDALKGMRNTSSHSTDSLKRKTNTVDHTTDTLKHSTEILSHSADSFLRTQNTLNHTTDTLLNHQYTVSHATSANKKKTDTTSHTTDTLKHGTLIRTHTTDSNKKKSGTISHTTDALKKTQNTRSHSTDSFLRKEVALTHTTDSVKHSTETLAHSTDALKREENTLAHTTDALLFERNTVDHSTDIVLRSQDIRSHLTDAFLRKQQSASHTTSSNKKKANTVAHTTDSLKRRVEAVSHSTDANIELGVITDTLAHSTDSFLRVQDTTSHTTNSFIRKTNTVAHTTSANKKKSDNVVSHSTDSLKRKANTVSHTTDANKRVAGLIRSHSTNSLLRTENTLAHATDALKRSEETLTHSTNSLLRVSGVVNHSANSNKRRADVVSHTSDSNKKNSNIVSHTTDSFKRIQDTVSHSTDSNKKKQTVTTHTLDALIRGENTINHTTSSNKKTSNSTSHPTDSLKRGRYTASHTTDVRPYRRLFSELVDDFDDGVVDGDKWEIGTWTHSESGGRAHFFLDGSGELRVRSAHLRSLIDNEFYFEYEVYLIAFTVGIFELVDSNENMVVQVQHIEDGTVYVSDSSANNVASWTYSPTTTRWVRFRESGGTYHIETTSHPSNGWTTQYSGTTVANMDNARFQARGGDAGANFTKDGASGWIDNFNTSGNQFDINHSTDSFLRISDTVNHTTDAVNRTQENISQTTDTLNRTANVLDYSTDSNKRVAGNVESHSTDAIKRKQFTVSHSTDSYTRPLVHTTDHTSDALLQERTTLVHSTDSLKRRAYEATHSTDSNLKKTESTTHTTDSLKKVSGLPLTHTTDSVIRKLFSSSHSTDSLKRITDTIDHTTNSFLRTSVEAGHLSDSLLREVSGVSHFTDSNKKKPAQTSHSTDSNNRISDLEVIHSTDAFKRAENTVTHTTDSATKFNAPPVVTLGTPDQAGFSTGTPSLVFTGIDENGDEIHYELQISDNPNFDWREL